MSDYLDSAILLSLDIAWPRGLASQDIADYLSNYDRPQIAGALRRMGGISLVKREPEGVWFLSQGAHRAIELFAADAREVLCASKLRFTEEKPA